MNKLQLYITMSHGDFRHMLDINGNDAVRSYVSDLSDAVEDVNYDATEKCIFYILKSTDRGTFVIVIRTIPDKAPDHLAAWIFIPYQISMVDTEITGIVSEVSRIVANSSVNNEHLATLHSIFDKDYPIQTDAGATVENQGKAYAHRFYGGYTGNFLSDIIGNKRYQTSYLPYAGVIVADRSKVSEILGANLTDEPLEPMVKILPPLVEDTEYRPYIFGHPFDKPYLAPLMATIDVIWENASDTDIRQAVIISHPEMRVESITENTSPANNVLQHIKTKASGTQYTDKPESEPQADARPTTKNGGMNTYNFEISSRSASISGMIEFTINTRSVLTESPIEGYDLTDNIQEGATRTNHLVYVPGNSLQNNALWALGGFVIGILLALLCTCGGSSERSDTNVQATDSTEIVERTDSTIAIKMPIDTSLEGAIKYLDTNQKWSKAELEAYPDLRGLYNDLNSINRERIMGHWATKLQESRQFAKIVEHAKNGKKKKARLPEGQRTFNVSQETTISVRSYLNCIDP